MHLFVNSVDNRKATEVYTGAMQSWKIFAVLYTLGTAGYAIGAKLTGEKISPLLAVIIMTSSALAVSLCLLFFYRLYDGHLTYTRYGIGAALFAGASIAIADLAIFFMYSRGAQLSVAGILTEVVAIAIVAFVGIIFLKEPLSITKAVGFLFSAIGIILLFEG
ncbi:MAG: hypothetical protein G01um10148_807 [Parcubacteria group bacterium Gr01-1014_8]|nr:MAG: hypothetical protein G01um10148_807 [Parcubacteria group bacterium Gr01-1014_8]